MITVGETVHVLANFYFEIISSCRDAFKDLINQQKIDLYGNNLAEIPEHLFQRCKEIKVIDLSANKITTLNKTLFWGLKKLTKLDLSFNRLSLIDG